ncbi:MAG: hypothetical protein ACPGR8_13535 [Limisphaerales bacterium]
MSNSCPGDAVKTRGCWPTHTVAQHTVLVRLCGNVHAVHWIARSRSDACCRSTFPEVPVNRCNVDPSTATTFRVPEAHGRFALVAAFSHSLSVEYPSRGTDEMPPT